MDFQRCVCVFLVIFAAVICSSQAYRFNVGGRDGWVLNPSENYNHWAQRMRFLVNDTLFFKYKKSSESVLVVSRDDYDKCNTDNPIVKMDGGDSEFKLDRSGPFYFITGNKGNCDKGQKVMIVVLAVRNPTTPPAPIGHAPAVAPPTGSTPMSPSPISPSPAIKPPAPIGHAPAVAPPTGSTPMSPSSMSPSPAILTLVPSPAPINHGPAAAAPTGSFPMAPSPMTASPTPAMTPVLPSPMSPSPAILTPVSSPSPAVSSSPPSPTPTYTPIVPSPMVSSPPAPSVSPPGGIAPNSGNNTPADVTAPAGARSSAQAFTPSIVLVSLVFSVALGSFIIST